MPLSSKPAKQTGSVLVCERLSVSFPGPKNAVVAVEDASLTLQPGRVLGVVGESGSGKSQLFMAMTGLSAARQVSGSVHFGGYELISAAERVLQRLRGRRIAYVFQDPMTALNPYLRVSTQLAEVATVHFNLDRAEAESRALEMLEKVQIPDAAARLRSFPHELSGGMRQRVIIAMAMMGDPDVLIADEPTTALDATVQIHILDLLRQLCDTEGLAMALITHDMGVIARIADEVMVMYAGRVVERGPAISVLEEPIHPYARRLIDSKSDLHRPLDKPVEGIPGQLPAPGEPRDRCLFAPRCVRAETVCHQVQPALEDMAGGRFAACHFPLNKPESAR